MKDSVMMIASFVLATVALLIALQNDALWLFLMLFFLLWADKLDKHVMARRNLSTYDKLKNSFKDYTDDK